MSKPRSIDTREYKAEVVKMLTQQGISASKAGRRLGIGSNLILRWKRELDAEGVNASPSDGNRSPSKEELHRLRAENKRLLLERSFVTLKPYAAKYFGCGSETVGKDRAYSIKKPAAQRSEPKSPAGLSKGPLAKYQNMKSHPCTFAV